MYMIICFYCNIYVSCHLVSNIQVEKEINAVRLTQHNHVVNYVEVLETKNRVFLVMEHVQKGEL